MTDDQVKRHIEHAAREMRDAIAALHPLLPHAAATDPTRGRGDPGCLAHRKAGVYVPSMETRTGPVEGTCRWHYDFQRTYGQMAPPELTTHHDAGYPVTPAMVARALGKKRAKPKVAKTPRQPTRRERMLTRLQEAKRRLGGPL